VLEATAKFVIRQSLNALTLSLWYRLPSHRISDVRPGLTRR
jgi:hypothetical protein